jgi:Holliday junction resolvase
MPCNARRKGKQGETEAVHFLRDHGFPDASRMLGQSRDGGADIVTGGYVWEIKRRKRIGLVYEWLTQVKEATTQYVGAKPVLLIRADNEEWLIVEPATQWMERHAQR